MLNTAPNPRTTADAATGALLERFVGATSQLEATPEELRQLRGAVDCLELVDLTTVHEALSREDMRLRDRRHNLKIHQHLVRDTGVTDDEIEQRTAEISTSLQQLRKWEQSISCLEELPDLEGNELAKVRAKVTAREETIERQKRDLERLREARIYLGQFATADAALSRIEEEARTLEDEERLLRERREAVRTLEALDGNLGKAKDHVNALIARERTLSAIRDIHKNVCKWLGTIHTISRCIREMQVIRGQLESSTSDCTTMVQALVSEWVLDEDQGRPPPSLSTPSDTENDVIRISSPQSFALSRKRSPPRDGYSPDARVRKSAGRPSHAWQCLEYLCGDDDNNCPSTLPRAWLKRDVLSLRKRIKGYTLVRLYTETISKIVLPIQQGVSKNSWYGLWIDNEAKNVLCYPGKPEDCASLLESIKGISDPTKWSIENVTLTTEPEQSA